MDGAGTPWPHCPAASCEPNNLTVSLAAESPDLCDGGTGAVPTEATEHEMLNVKYPSRASQTFRVGIRPPPSRRRCLGLTPTCSADLLPGAPRSPPPHTEAPSHPRSPAPPATRCRGPGAGGGGEGGVPSQGAGRGRGTEGRRDGRAAFPRSLSHQSRNPGLTLGAGSSLLVWGPHPSSRRTCRVPVGHLCEDAGRLGRGVM